MTRVISLLLNDEQAPRIMWQRFYSRFASDRLFLEYELYDFFFEIESSIISFTFFKLLIKNGWLNRMINAISNNGYVNKSVEFMFDRLPSTGIIMLSKLYEYIIAISFQAMKKGLEKKFHSGNYIASRLHKNIFTRLNSSLST